MLLCSLRFSPWVQRESTEVTLRLCKPPNRLKAADQHSNAEAEERKLGEVRGKRDRQEEGRAGAAPALHSSSPATVAEQQVQQSTEVVLESAGSYARDHLL